jgi:predicted HD superfamily hydrolase involved in NAD metabolism
MYDTKLILKKLQESMTNNGEIHKRYYHSLEVANIALKLNEHLNLKLDETIVYLASILHDCAKLYSKDKLWDILVEFKDILNLESIKNYPSIWHSFAGKKVAKDYYNINDENILSAIFYHTTGKPNMTTLEKLIFVSDYIEESRTGDYVLVARKACFKNLNYGVYIVLKQMIEYLNSNNYDICSLTLDAFNYYKENGEKC